MRKLLNQELPRLSKDEFKQQAKTPIIIVLDNVRSHLNVGSVFRTADAFLIEAIYLCGITGTPPHRDIHKTALGATDTVTWKHFESTNEAIAQLKADGVKIISIEQADNATMLDVFVPEPNQRYAVVFGNEVDGVAQDVVSESDMVVEIPQYGTKHSLNISVSVGIVVWDLVCKMRK
ncbi:MAG TPA: RNA methyltransferase [Chitinophagales bacterium]|nr:RNA methyltransferase [Chitinophagales bacterium]